MKHFFRTLFALLVIVPAIAATSIAQRNNSRVVGGEIAGKRTRRHLVLLEISLKDGFISSCTGTIYKRQWIMTAAHCVEGMDVSSSYAYISPKSASPSGETQYYFESVFKHRRYKSSNPALKNDIAMIKLERRISRKKYFPVKVGDPPKEGTKVYGAGYGVLNEDGEPADYAMETKLIAQDFETCRDIEFESLHPHLSERTHVCATSVGFPDKGKTDTCYGDSGGPVYRKQKGKLRQYGITSFSTTGCAYPGGTPWYTRVSTYKKHINRLVRKGKSSKFKKVR